MTNKEKLCVGFLFTLAKIFLINTVVCAPYLLMARGSRNVWLNIPDHPPREAEV